MKPSITNDIETYWISWEFFRNTDYLQFPLLLNPSYGEGLNVSIYHTDAIPIAAFLFRFFSNVLPDNFQYLGSWTLFSFFLMSFFSYKVLNLFIENKSVCFVSSIFFLIAPPFMDRVFLQQAVSSHWLILAAIYFYYSNNIEYRSWNLLLILSILINGYLAMIVFAVFTANIYLLYFRAETLNFFKKFFVSLILMSFVSYATGLFSIGKGIKEGGYDLYGMSIMGFLNPSSPTGFYSIIFDKLFSPSVLFVKEVEGFAFLGTGVLLLVILVLFKLRSKASILLSSKIHLPIILVAILLFLYSLSNNIFILGNVDFLGSERIFTYNVPEFLEPVIKVFRASGRFSWLLFYIIYIFLFVRFSEFFNTKRTLTILLALFLVQVVDNYRIINIFKNELESTPIHSQALEKIKLRNPIWHIVGKEYKKVKIYPLVNKPKDYTRMAFFASTRGLSTNFGYFSRINHTVKERLNDRMYKNLKDGVFPERTFYIIQDDLLWKTLLTTYNENSSSVFIGEIDGYKLLIPGLRK
ncbi:hypothetical protein HN460_04170 [bacterium]|nr:hypothetical protein [bacterium]MBT3795252.1 hypothetical protein [bacterium]MBT4634108.1 hypothetical protein [bacterium]